MYALPTRSQAARDTTTPAPVDSLRSAWMSGLGHWNDLMSPHHTPQTPTNSRVAPNQAGGYTPNSEKAGPLLI